MNKRTEKAIKKWLKLKSGWRYGFVDEKAGSVVLCSESGKWGDYEIDEIARFTLASVIKKRYPAKKKKRAK